MERNYKFKIGQKVKMKDPDDGEMAKGEVTDTTSDSVFIQWDDISEPCQHFQDEFEDIKLDTFRA